MSNVVSRQREFFEILDEFFKDATGERPEAFAEIDKFGEAIRTKGKRLAPGSIKAFQKLADALRKFYGEGKTTTFAQAREIGGMKLVLGGGSRFTSSHLASVRKMALYADTILVPDPVLPWLEVERKEEKFRHINLLQAVFFLLRLKPLVDADLPYPAVMTFQSWQKSLEKNDPVTKERMEGLILAFFSQLLGRHFATTAEVLSFVRQSSAEFLTEVKRRRLFVAPGGTPDEPLSDAIRHYRDEIGTWRSAEMNHELSKYPDADLVWLGICERVAPQYHLLENAEELNAQPMLCLPQHWHYYKLCAETFEGRLTNDNLLSPETVSSLRALDHPSLEWLGNVPIDVLANLRVRNENEGFRRRISDYTSALHSASLDDLDKVAREVSRGIAGLISDHQNEVRRMEEKYKRKYMKTAVAAWSTAAATFLPALGPFLAPLAVPAVAGTYLWDKVDERAERKQAAKSLTGVLAAAREDSD
jgi:hypothetical protein